MIRCHVRRGRRHPRGADSTSGSEPVLEGFDPLLTKRDPCEGAARTPINELPGARDSEPWRGHLSTKRQVKGALVLRLSAERTGDSQAPASVVLMACLKQPHITPAPAASCTTSNDIETRIAYGREVRVSTTVFRGPYRCPATSSPSRHNGIQTDSMAWASYAGQGRRPPSGRSCCGAR